MKAKVAILLLLVALGCAGFVTFKFYSYLFARNVSGEIIGIERVAVPEAIVLGNMPANTQIFSFAVAVREMGGGEIITASSEDRQWAVAQKGQCVEAKFLRYPPWNLEKAGTYFGARLIKLYDCPDKAPAPAKSSSS